MELHWKGKITRRPPKTGSGHGSELPLEMLLAIDDGTMEDELSHNGKLKLEVV
jgi:hypothetical protein